MMSRSTLFEDTQTFYSRLRSPIKTLQFGWVWVAEKSVCVKTLTKENNNRFVIRERERETENDAK